MAWLHSIACSPGSSSVGFGHFGDSWRCTRRRSFHPLSSFFLGFNGLSTPAFACFWSLLSGRPFLSPAVWSLSFLVVGLISRIHLHYRFIIHRHNQASSTFNPLRFPLPHPPTAFHYRFSRSASLSTPASTYRFAFHSRIDLPFHRLVTQVCGLFGLA